MASRVLLLLGALVSASAIAIMGVDFGSDFMKVSVVKPGMPFQVVANFQSKRKTPAMLSFYAGERGFGADAEALLGRKPSLVVISPQSLLGRNSTHALAHTYLSERYYATPTELNERGGLDYILSEPGKESQRFSAEEASAMLLGHARDYASAVTGQKIVDAVITVPSFYSQSERLALITAAELAGLKVLSLVDENTAAGIHYGIDRVHGTNGTKAHIMALYNMGAEATQVTVFQYDSYVIAERGSSKNKTIGQATVLSKAWDVSLGGHAFDNLLMDYVAEAFNNDKAKAKHLPASANGDIRNVPQAMAKMRKSVVKTKEVLSANEEYGLTMEGLLPDVDFKVQLSRSKLEALALEKGLTKRITAVAEEALRLAGVSMPALDTLEIVGGGVRMPMVQRTLRDWLVAGGAGASAKDTETAAASEELPAHLQMGPLGQHLNGDEAMTLGAAFLAANRSSAFRVRKVGMIDSHPFGVGVRVSILPTSASAAAPADAAAGQKPWSKRSSLFRVGNVLDSAKRISFATDKDLRAVLFYEAPESSSSNSSSSTASTAAFSTAVAPQGTPKNVAAFNVTGIAALVEEQSRKEAERLQAMKEEGLELPASAVLPTDDSPLVLTPKVHLSFELDHSGIVRLSRAEAVFEVTEREKEVIKTTPSATASASPSAEDGAATPTATPTSSTDEATEVDKDKKEDVADATATATATATAAPTPVTTVVYKAVRRTARFALTVVDDSSADGILPVKPMDKAAKQAALASLARLAKLDEERHAREQAKNSVEAAIYATREKLSNEEEALSASKVATEEQIEALREVLMATEDWLYDDGASTDVETYKGKLKAITDLSGPIFTRLEEHANRPKLIEETQGLVSGSRLLLESFPKTHPQVTEEELGNARAEIDKFDAWLTKAIAEQEALPAHETPVLTRALVDSKLKPLSDILTKLSKKPKPTPTPSPAAAKDAKDKKEKKEDAAKSEKKAEKAQEEKKSAAEEKKEGEAAEANPEHPEEEQVEVKPTPASEAEGKTKADEEKPKAASEEGDDEEEAPAGDADFAELEAEARAAAAEAADREAAAAGAGDKDEL